MMILPTATHAINKLLDEGIELPLATKNYPSRGQTAVQKLYQTKIGKIFLKRSSAQNHIDCQIDPKTGTLAEREYWAYRIADRINLRVPTLRLLDDHTTVQTWLDIPDAHLYKASQGRMDFVAENILNCAVFDWLTGQIDRHDANYLYDYVNKRVVPIDSAYAFLKYEGSLPDYLHLFEVGNEVDLPKRMPSIVMTTLRSLTDGELTSLAPLRNEDERNALLKRKDDLKGIRTIQDVIHLFRRGKR